MYMAYNIKGDRERRHPKFVCFSGCVVRESSREGPGTPSPE